MLAGLITRGVKLGVATSIRNALWTEAQIFPQEQNATLTLTGEQQNALRGFTFGR